MRERELGFAFRNYLLAKGYPQGSLLSEVPLRTGGERLFRPDLIILDVYNNEYIAIVEFKNKIDNDVKVNALGQLAKYSSLLGVKKIPGYLVVPNKEHEFQILVQTEDNNFEPIAKEEFPSFESLSAKRLAEEKIKQREIEKETLGELQKKQLRTKQTAYLVVLSLFMGIIGAIYAVFLQRKKFSIPVAQNTQCCDSLAIKYKRLGNDIYYLKSHMSNDIKVKNDTTVSKPSILLIEKRLKIIESGISESPEKVLSILQVRQDIELLKKADESSKELMQSKIEALRSEIQVQNGWVIGILITIVGSVLSFIIPNLLDRNKSSNV